jgi:hypothetical protein
MNQPKVIDADGHIYENHEGSKNTSRANIAAGAEREFILQRPWR